jgi:hypothetical protein
MVNFEKSAGRVTVYFAGKALDFRLDHLPPDWETLFRDPDTAGCVNEIVAGKGVPEASGERPLLGWEEVRMCVERVSGSSG